MKSVLVSIILLCMPLWAAASVNGGEPSDVHASVMTKTLFRHLQKSADRFIMFGQQDATAYGHSWKGDEDRSDVKDVTGSHPAVIGFDFSGLTSPDTSKVKREMVELRKSICDTYHRGGIVTMCLHCLNPVNDSTYYFDKNSVVAVPMILQKGEVQDKFLSYLDRIAQVALSVKNEKGDCIPIIFRPFHEFDGDWFWWGKSHCTKEQFVQLWRMTVDYLRDYKQVHSILYAFSPDCKFTSEAEYLDRYPGDDYVDIMGVDDYWDFRSDGGNNPALVSKKLQIVSGIAKSKNKLAAFTETGSEGVKQVDWYTNVLLPVLKDRTLKLTYVLVWRNAYDISHHYYTPFVGHPAAADFRKFCNDKLILLEKDLKHIYK